MESTTAAPASVTSTVTFPPTPVIKYSPGATGATSMSPIRHHATPAIDASSARTIASPWRWRRRTPSAPCEARWTALDERLQAFLEVLRTDQEHQLHQHVVRMGGEVLGEAVPVEALDRPHGERRIGGDLAGPLHRRRHELRGGHDGVHQAELEGALGTEVVGEEGDLAGARPAHQPRQVPGSSALRQDAALGESGHKNGGVTHQPDVAAEREVETVPGGGAVERAQHRRVELVEHDGRQVAGAHVARTPAREHATDALPLRGVLEVEAAAEAIAGAREDQAAHLRIAIGIGQRARERVEHLEADRVQPLRTVQREDADAVALLVEQVGHGHGPDTPC